MDIFVYLIVGAIATYVGRIEKRVNVASVSIPIAIPLGLFQPLGRGIALIVMFKLALIAVGILFLLVSKLKFLFGAKLIGILGSIAAAFFGVAIGPIGWILVCIALMIFAASLKDALVESFLMIYRWFFRKFAELLLWIRRVSDSGRKFLYWPFRPIVLLFEVPLVCGSSTYTLWEVQDWLDGNVPLTRQRLAWRVVTLIPFVFYSYKAYIKDTTPPEGGGEGIDIPMPIQILPPPGL